MHIYTGRAIWAAAIVALVALGGCSDNDNDRSANGSDSPDLNAPGPLVIEGTGNVQVHYPPPVASTSAEQVVIRGITEDPSQVAEISVNGTPVLTDDDLASWSVTVFLDDGINEFVVTQEDAEGISSEVGRLQLERTAEIIAPRSLVFDPDGGRLFLLDAATQGIVSVDIETGARRAFSPAEADTDTLLTNARGMVLDAANNRLLVYQAQVNQTATEDEETPADEEGTPAEEEEPSNDETNDIEDFDPDSQEQKVNPFIAVDLTTGAQSVFNYTPPADTYLANSPRAMAISDGVAYVSDVEALFYDADGNRVFPEVLDETAQDTITELRTAGIINRMDLSTGEMSIFSNFGTPDEDSPLAAVFSLTSDDNSDYIYGLDISATGNRLLQIAKADGERTVVSTDGTVEGSEQPITLTNSKSLTLDHMNQRLLLSRNAGMLSIALATGKISVLSATGVPADSDFPLNRIGTLAFDKQNNLLYTAEEASSSVLAVNGASGERSWVSGAAGGTEGESALSTPACLALAPQQHDLLICDPLPGTAYIYDLVSGQKQVAASRADVAGTDEPSKIQYPLSATHRSGDTFLVLDNFNQSPFASKPRAPAPRLLSVDALTGELTLAYSFNSLGRLNDIIYEQGSNSAYVADGIAIRKLRFDEDRVVASVFSGGNIPNLDYRFQNVKSIALDYQHNRILALDSILNAVIAVDWNTRQRSPLSMMTPLGGGEPDFGPNLLTPQSLVVDHANNRALVLDSTLEAIVAVDLESGQREIIYQSPEKGSERLFNGRDLELHPFGYLLVVDDVKDRVMALDLTTQQLVNLVR